MNAKRTSWNEFSSAMASAVICLSAGRKFNFSKYIFESLVRNVDSSSKFYMYPMFIQLIIQNQLGNLSTHTTKYTSHALTPKDFANTRRVGKGFSGVEKPLFEGMLVAGKLEEQGDTEEQVQDNVDDAAQGADTGVSGDVVQDQSIPSPTPPPQQPQDLPSTSQLKKWVKKLERDNKVKVLKLRRLKKVGTSQRIESSADTDMEDASNQGRMIADLDRDTGVALMDDEGTKKKAEDAQVAGDEHVKGRQAKIYQINLDHASKVLSMKEDEPEVHEALDVVTTAKLITEVVAAKKQQVEMDEEYARKLHEELNKDIDWSVATDHVKQKAKEDSYVQRYQSKEQIEEEENRAIESINETPAQKAAKRRKLNEKVEDLKQHLEIVPDEDDDVYT
nr:hypothetical protein [Tanacetum cinerariifolium]